MIGTILQISWLNLKRDRLALALTFVLPMVFFSIFAAVFGSMDGGNAGTLKAMVVVEDDSAWSGRLEDLLHQAPSLDLVPLEETGLEVTAPRQLALSRVRSGEVAVAVVIPQGFGAAFEEIGSAEAEIELLADTSNPLAVSLVAGVLQASALQLGYELLTQAASESSENVPATAQQSSDAGPLRIQVEDVLGKGGKKPSVAFFAAGIGVMFLLFAISGRSAILIEERESGVLTRMLTSKLTMAQLLLGRWLFLTLLGFLQVTLMFAFGALFFGLELWTGRHLAGFLTVTVVTAAAAAGFGLILATACRSRAQLNGISAVIILIMSALGGSMFPRFLMPETLQKLGLVTFNAWALDGYQKVFWYEARVTQLWPQLAVLAALTLLFLAVARALATRWQTD